MEEYKSKPEKIKDGNFILEEGTWAFYAYILHSGKAKVFKNIHGKQVQIGSLHKGDVFGEMAFLGGTKRTSSVVADGDVEVEAVPKDVFMEALDELSGETRKELKTLVSDLTAISEVLAQITSRAKTIEEIKQRSVEIKSLEKVISSMPKSLQGMVLGLAQKRNKATERCAQLAKEIEEATKSID